MRVSLNPKAFAIFSATLLCHQLVAHPLSICRRIERGLVWEPIDEATLVRGAREIQSNPQLSDDQRVLGIGQLHLRFLLSQIPVDLREQFISLLRRAAVAPHDQTSQLAFSPDGVARQLVIAQELLPVDLVSLMSIIHELSHFVENPSYTIRQMRAQRVSELINPIPLTAIETVRRERFPLSQEWRFLQLLSDAQIQRALQRLSALPENARQSLGIQRFITILQMRHLPESQFIRQARIASGYSYPAQIFAEYVNKLFTYGLGGGLYFIFQRL